MSEEPSFLKHGQVQALLSEESLSSRLSNPNLRRNDSLQEDIIKNRKAFLSDEEIGANIFYQIFYWLYVPFSLFLHAFTFVGLEKLPEKGKGALLVYFHTTHNQDIFLTGGCIYKQTGRVIRGLFHRTLYKYTPILKYLGGVPGTRSTAKHLLKRGFLVAVIPGGAEEALLGHENAYAVQWESSTGRPRCGFAKAALSVGTPIPIYPVFTKNAEEMRWNPIISFCNFIGLTRLWTLFLRTLKQIGAPAWLQRFLFMVGGVLWYTLSYLTLPVPVQATTYIGDPIIADPDRHTPEDVAVKVRVAMEEMITTHQPYAPAKCYTHALKERFSSRYIPPYTRPSTRLNACATDVRKKEQ